MAKRKNSDTETPVEKIKNSQPLPTVIDKKYDLKIISWNVAGFKAILKKGFDEYFKAEKPDIICLQETKCSEMAPYSHKQANLFGAKNEYKYYWHTNEKPGYAGVSVWSLISPINVTYGINNGEDNQGRVITLEFENMYTICVYVPNSGEKLVNLKYRQEWNKHFRDYIVSLKKSKPVVVCGDLNVAHNRIDLTNPDTNTRSAGFTIEERDDFTDLLSCGFIDVYRYLYPEKENSYTYWSYRRNCRANNVGWRIDYFLVPETFSEKIVECIPRSDIMGSDHCPLVLFIKK